MFNISKRAQLALYVLVELAKNPRQCSTEQLAQLFDASANHLAKVLQTLARAGWITGTRGAKGGYNLTSDPREISMADVIELFEGSPEIDNCRLRFSDTICRWERACEIRQVVREIDEQAYYTMKSVTIRLLADPPDRAVREPRASLSIGPSAD